MSLTRRSVDLQFRLGTGAFGADGSNTIDLTGHRCSANVVQAGGVSMTDLDLRVWGLPLEVMNKLTILNILTQYDARKNIVVVRVGPSVVFSGIITACWADMSGPPESVLYVRAHTGYVDKIRPVKPLSYKGDVDVATLIAGIGRTMEPKRSLANFGVDAVLRDPYLPGTAMNQLYRVGAAVNINIALDGDAHFEGNAISGPVIVIWPMGSKRGDRIIDVSTATGMVGYPVYTQAGLQFTHLFNPSFTFGAPIRMNSELTPAGGNQWVIASVSHNLDGDMPGGQWFTRVECGLLGQVVPVVPVVTP